MCGRKSKKESLVQCNTTIGICVTKKVQIIYSLIFNIHNAVNCSRINAVACSYNMATSASSHFCSLCGVLNQKRKKIANKSRLQSCPKRPWKPDTVEMPEARGRSGE